MSDIAITICIAGDTLPEHNRYIRHAIGRECQPIA